MPAAELPSISLLGEQAQTEDSDELALGFVNERLGAFDIERTKVLGGRVVVSRALAEGAGGGARAPAGVEAPPGPGCSRRPAGGGYTDLVARPDHVVRCAKRVPGQVI